MNALLDKAISMESLTEDTSPESRLLGDMQGNIVKAHRCPFAFHLFVNFRDGSRAKRCLREMVTPDRPWQITRARDQVLGAKWLSGNGPAGDQSFLSVVLSHWGYKKLEIDPRTYHAMRPFYTECRSVARNGSMTTPSFSTGRAISNRLDLTAS